MKKRVSLIIGFLLLSSLASALAIYHLVKYYRIPSTGKVKTLGLEVYWDQECTQLCTEINWGYLSPEISKNVTLYLKRTGNVNCTLWMYTENWNPENASMYFNVTWNREGYLMTEEVINATITITLLNETYFENFTFDMVFKAVEAPYPPNPPG